MKEERFAIFEAIPNRIVPLGRATLEEAKDTYRSLRGLFPHAPVYLVRVNVIEETAK